MVGRENSGKSTVLERLCMIPLFPHDRTVCTRMAIRIKIRHSAAALPPTLEVWDMQADRRIGQRRCIPLVSGNLDIQNAMREVIVSMAGAAAEAGISEHHELRVSIVSPDLPPMNLVDLLGIVEVPENLKVKLPAPFPPFRPLVVTTRGPAQSPVLLLDLSSLVLSCSALFSCAVPRFGGPHAHKLLQKATLGCVAPPVHRAVQVLVARPPQAVCKEQGPVRGYDAAGGGGGGHMVQSRDVWSLS